MRLPRPELRELPNARVWRAQSASEPGVTHITVASISPSKDGVSILCTCKGFQLGSGCWHTRQIAEMLQPCGYEDKGALCILRKNHGEWHLLRDNRLVPLGN